MWAKSRDSLKLSEVISTYKYSTPNEGKPRIQATNPQDIFPINVLAGHVIMLGPFLHVNLQKCKHTVASNAKQSLASVP